METIVWHVEATGAPAALRPCGTCGADAEFVSTGLFRVNAQKKRLDVWLIYRCATCGSVWNSAVISRGNARSVDREKLQRFQNNDAELACACALDASILKRNGARRGKVDFTVEGAGLDGVAACQIDIECAQPLGLRLAAVLRRKLSLSRGELAHLVEEDIIGITDGSDVLSAKLQPRQVVVVRGL